jgi:hypothetical protein
MSNVNNYAFANKLESFKQKILDPQIKRVADAEKIMHDDKYPWESDESKKAGQAKYDSYKAWLAVYQTHFDEGMKLVNQHEQLTDKLSKWYDKWRNDVSNEGVQEVEMMSMQAEFLNEIFCEMYKELLPLGLDGMKAPAALNMK